MQKTTPLSATITAKHFYYFTVATSFGVPSTSFIPPGYAPGYQR